MCFVFDREVRSGGHFHKTGRVCLLSYNKYIKSKINHGPCARSNLLIFDREHCSRGPSFFNNMYRAGY